MNTVSDDSLPVLRFWRDLEIFNIPTAPSKRDSNEQTKVQTIRRGQDLPWRLKEFAPNDKVCYVHVVYLGVAKMEDLSGLLLQGLFPDRDLNEGERQRASGYGWLGAFVVDELGRPQPDSYLPASFAHGVAALREEGALDHINARLERAKEEFAQRRQPLSKNEQQEATANAENCAPSQAVLDWTHLDEELRIACGLLGAAASDQQTDWHLVVRTSRVKKSRLDDSLQAANDFLNSFYLDDLDRLIAQAEKKQSFGKALSAYLGPALPEDQRVDILTNNRAMTELVSAQHLPSARWPAPAKYPLVLAQQAAVAQVIGQLGQAEGLIGINGPPGTGKTTLLCDVIAEIVTERARRIAALREPSDLFDNHKLTIAGKSFFPLKDEVVAGSSIVVTSTNNNAVKNITQELPARKKVASEFGAADYFAQVMREVFRAQKVLDEEIKPIEPWGVFAAALGNSGNRRSFAQGFFRDEQHPARAIEQPERQEHAEGPDTTDQGAKQSSLGHAQPQSMKQLLEAAWADRQRFRDEWQIAKQSFRALLSEFEQYRDVLKRAEKAAEHFDDGQSRLNALLSEEKALAQDIQARELALAQRRQALAAQHAVVDGNRVVLEQLRSGTPRSLWDSLIGLCGRETRRMAVLRQSLQAPTQALADASATLAQMSEKLAMAENQLSEQKKRQDAVSSARLALENELETHRQALHAAHALGAKHFPSPQFWSLPVDYRQRASVAVGPKLDELRASLFLRAMDLHRLSVLANAGKFIANLRAVNGMLTGGLRDKLQPEERPLLWNAFFFVVPVVSTTLASFDRLFVDMGQESLGWLLIDEAGQATPQSAAGAIWRSKRVVIVGDPLQIEPVFTVPHSVAEQLRCRHSVPSLWSPIDESVQTLADRITCFGSWIEQAASTTSQKDTAERLWTGMPLRTHRRCDDPMFSVANQIAYAGQMVQGRVDESGQPTPWDFSCSLGSSAWFDVHSSRVSHPVSEDEIDLLLECLEKLRHEKDGKTKVYVISPFRKIAQVCGQRIQARRFSGIECGTVHTFQGKEAHIVFLVLGTAPGQAGSGARNWAASKPNLLNVAVTRAQCRLYVIGDAEQWGKLNYFTTLLKQLPTKVIENSNRSIVSGTIQT